MMRALRLSALGFALTLVSSNAAFADGASLEAAFADDAWDGVTVPDGGQCQKFGGTLPSPALNVSGIPRDANALIIEYSDRDYTPMDNGGHGKVGYRIDAGAGAVTVPPVPPHTSDLPTGFWSVAEHGAPSWDKPGTYLPPCSGGKGNAYYLTVRAVMRDGDALTELARTQLEMGRY